MRFEQKTVTLKNGAQCILRSPDVCDSLAMVEYLKQTSGETHFMIRRPEEVTLTCEDEAIRLINALSSPTELMIAAFVDGELAGNCGINCVARQIKLRHRCEFGISIKRRFWGVGIGKTLLSEVLAAAAGMGYEQMELSVYSDNDRARALYEKFGFEVYGRVPDAYKLDDSAYSDEIIMGRRLI